MALRDQPYLPLYVQDVLTDEKLIECSAEAQGVYFRLLCILHKQNEYGCFLLKQKYKQSTQQVENFATALAKPIAISFDVIKKALIELLDEKVLFIEDNKLCQKRMIKDAEISEKRALAGKSGGRRTAEKNKSFAKAKKQANTESENVIENESKNETVVFEKGVEKTFDRCLEFFPPHLHPKNPGPWMETIDKLNRIDKMPFEKIIEITQRTRSDDFWAKNFLTLPKLRKKNPEGIPYVVVFNEKLKPSNQNKQIKFETNR